MACQDSAYQGSIAALDVLQVQLQGSSNISQPLQQVSLGLIHLKLLTLRQAGLHPTILLDAQLTYHASATR